MLSNSEAREGRERASADARAREAFGKRAHARVFSLSRERAQGRGGSSGWSPSASVMRFPSLSRFSLSRRMLPKCTLRDCPLLSFPPPLLAWTAERPCHLSASQGKDGRGRAGGGGVGRGRCRARPPCGSLARALLLLVRLP